MTARQIQEQVKDYILKDFLPGVSPSELSDSTPLITGGILDSLSTIKLVAFLEEQFKIELQAYESTADYMNTISDIAALVASKL